jgi:hypothetical protein
MNKEERQAALEAICRLEPDAKNYREEYPTQCESADGDAMIVRAALQSATISETQLESEIKKPTMPETQAVLPDFIYVGRVRGDRLICFEADESDETKYIRADIQSRQPKLERVDLDQFLLKSVNHYCDGNNRAISLIKAKYGELYAEVKE